MKKKYISACGIDCLSQEGLKKHEKKCPKCRQIYAETIKAETEARATPYWYPFHRN